MGFANLFRKFRRTEHDFDDERSEPDFHSPSITIQLYKASGGTVIEIRAYDVSKDENYTNLYVISSEKDLGHELSKIITYEAIRR